MQQFALAAEMMTPNRRYFVIFAAMRSGSNLLERSLEQYDGISVHGELFNPSFVGKAGAESACGFTVEQRERNPAGLVEAMRDSVHDTMPGFRIFDGHDARIEENCLRDPACAKVILQRDTVQSYVSLKAARATNQWMLRPVAKRKTARVTFDPDEFARYHQASRAYYRRLRRGLQTSGQTAFLVRYEDLQDRDILDGLARFLGVTGSRREERVKIRRQNPESLADRVGNYPEMRATLDAMGLSTDVQPFDGEPRRGPSVGQMAACRNLPLLTAIVPGCPLPGLLEWMCSQDQEIAGKITGLLRPKNQKELNLWLAEHPGARCMSVVRHPLDRAYDVFMRRVFAGGYPAIRQRLERHFGLELPEPELASASPETLKSAGYGVTEHRRALAVFLEFVRANLAGQTGIRTDAEWASQVSHLEGFSQAIPASQVMRETELGREIGHIAERLGLPEKGINAAGDTSKMPFGLADIYDGKIEKLARKAYAKDYLKLGFEDWSAAR